MKTITNKTRKPIKVPLRGGKVLYLAPLKTGQISDQASEGAAFLRLVASGEIAIIEEGSQSQSAAGGGGAGGHESTHGHPQTTTVRPKGNR